MEQNAARNLAIDLMSQHGLMDQGWVFAFDRAKRRLGQCTYTLRRITISHYMVGAASVEQVTQTLLHEIAHALLPPHDDYGRKVGHGPRWKQKAAEIGYTGGRLSRNPYQSAPTRQRTVRVAAGPTETLRVGDVGVIRSRGQFDGSQFTVVKVNRTRYRGKLGDGRLLTVPFGIAEKV